MRAFILWTMLVLVIPSFLALYLISMTEKNTKALCTVEIKSAMYGWEARDAGLSENQMIRSLIEGGRLCTKEK